MARVLLSEYTDIADSEENKDRIISQWNAAVYGDSVICRCGYSDYSEYFFRCIYCGEFFCSKCGEEHFGMTRSEWNYKQKQNL